MLHKILSVSYVIFSLFQSHAYNNLDFRKSISEPVLCDFQSANITKDENSVTVTIIFTPLVTDKSGLSASEGKIFILHIF